MSVLPIVTIVGSDSVGVIAESDGFRYYLTPCCGASAKGSYAGDEPATVCRACYEVVDDALGGIVPEGEPEHVAAVERNASTRYPWQAVCGCGWVSSRYVAEHAARLMADEHLGLHSR